MRRLAPAVLSLAFLAACQPATIELSEERKAEISAQVNAVKADFWDAWRETDVEAGMSYYLNSPEFVFVNDGLPINGWTAVNQFAQSSEIASQTITLVESKATVLALDVVHVAEHGTYSTVAVSGETGPEVAFAFSGLWVNEGGDWKVHFAHLSRFMPETQ